MDKLTDGQVRQRANNRCEYCHLPQSASRLIFPLDHIIAQQHGGLAELSNLALCCGRCNRFKGPNLAGLDPLTHKLTRLFHPRNDLWSDHFRLDGPTLLGLTDVGRTTVKVLNINHPSNIIVRCALVDTPDPQE